MQNLKTLVKDWPVVNGALENSRDSRILADYSARIGAYIDNYALTVTPAVKKTTT